MNYKNTPEVAKALNVSETTLKLWEKEFDIRVPRGTRNRRLYSPDHISLLGKIGYLKDKGKEKEEIHTLLASEIEMANEAHADEGLQVETENPATPSEVALELTRQLGDAYRLISELHEKLRGAENTSTMYQERCKNLEGQLAQAMANRALPPAPGEESPDGRTTIGERIKRALGL